MKRLLVDVDEKKPHVVKLCDAPCHENLEGRTLIKFNTNLGSHKSIE